GHFIGGVVAGKAVVAEADADVAVAAEGGVTGTGAVVGLGKADAYGGHFTGGPDGADGAVGIGTNASAGVGGEAEDTGVIGEATDTGGTGVRGVTAAAATNNAAGVRGVGLGNGNGVVAIAVSDGYGVYAQASGSRPALFLETRSDDPSSTTLGGIWARTSQGIKAFIAGVARHLWHTAGGAAIAWDSDLTGDTVDDEPDAILSCTISGADAPLVTGTVWILAAIEVGRHTGTADLE